MASSTSSGTVKVPPSTANYTVGTLDPDLRSNINARLIIDGHVAKIQDHLLHSLNSHSSNWPTAVSDHALALLRSGEVTSFPALLKRVLDDIRTDTLPAGGGGGKAAGGTTNGDSAKRAVNGASGSGLAVPKAVVDETLKVTKDCLESVIEFEENGA